MFARAIGAIGLFLLAFAAATEPARSAERYIAFGDSLSDPGNLYRAIGAPGAPYYAGHFSNGSTWFEQIAGTPSNFYSFPGGGAGNVDFAFGGARTDNGLYSTGLPSVLPFGVQSQIASYFARGGTISASDTVALWAGANNLFNAFDPTYPGFVPLSPAIVAATMTSAATDMNAAIATLVAHGARKIVILNLPDIGLTPAYRGGPGQSAATFGSVTFNTQLSAQLATLKAANPSVSIVQVDVQSVFSLVSANPQAFGFSNASSACITTPACVTGTTAAQNQYAFWDSVHPTAAGHALIAAIVEQYLAAQSNGAGLARLADAALTTRSEAAQRIAARFDEIRRGARRENGAYVEIIGGHDSGDYTRTSVGLAAGLHRAIDANSSLLFEGFFRGGDWKAGLYRSDLVEAGADVAWQYTTGRYFVRAAAGTGFSYFDGVERSTVANLKNKSDPIGVTGSALVEAGLVYPVGEVTMSPRLRAGWLVANFDSIVERGIVAPLSMSAHTVSTLTGGAELQASRDVTIGGARKVTITGTLGYERWFAMSGYAIDAVLANNTANAFRVGGSNPTGPGLLLGLGVNGRVSETTTFTADYRIGVGTHTTRQDARAGLQIKF